MIHEDRENQNIFVEYLHSLLFLILIIISPNYEIAMLWLQIIISAIIIEFVFLSENVVD